MPETTINTQLSGTEVIEAIVDNVRSKLQRDCFLNANSAYDFFKARILIDIDLHDMGTDVPVKSVVEVVHGDRPEDETEVQTNHASVIVEEAPPNDVRVQTGQGVPTLVTDVSGKQELTRIRYGRPKRA